MPQLLKLFSRSHNNYLELKMEEFWKAIDTPAKHPSERGLRTLTSQTSSIYDHPYHDLKAAEHSKASPHEGTSSISLKVEFLEISLSEINEATNNFSKCHIGSGGYADVYKAELHVIDIQSLSKIKVKCIAELPKIKKTVAIKKFKDRVDEQAKQGFEAEIKLLTSCKHPNIISLLGYSKEHDVLVLVYEFAINGSLASYFESNSKKVNLTWAQRLQICLDTANGINYLHSDMKGKEEIIHRDIKSDNILLDENLNAKVADFGLSKFRPTKKVETYLTKIIAGTDVYMDPEYWYESKYKMESDIYSFGVVLFEVLCGRLAYDPIYQNRMGLAPIARRHCKDSTIKNLIDPKIIEEVHNDMFTINRGLSQDPFESISKIAFQCIAETHVDRPPMAVIIKELQDAVNLQEFKSATNNFSTILLSATNNFSNERLITEDSFGKLYNGELLWNGNLMNFTVRRLDRMHVQGEELQNEISTLKSLKHKHIISVLGHYDGSDEKIIIYEHAFHGTLDQHLSDPSLTWAQRVKICLGVAHALSYIYYDVIHCDINSSKIILDEDWEPKIYGFELSTNYPQSLRHRLLYSRYFDTNNMTPESDVYSFGVLLLEILCGKKLVITNVDPEELDRIIDPNLREQMDTEWLRKFKDLAFECLNRRSMQQPTMDEIVKELEEVLHLQWEHENDVHSKVEDEDEGTSSNTFKMELLKIPLSEIKRATNDFNEGCLVGSGGYANVYKAELDVLDIQCWSSMRGECKEDLPKIRKTVAIKRIFTRGDSQDERVFTAELEILASCKHPNIVSILGFSSEDDERILVIEYATYGSLGDYYNSKRFSLTWAQRLQICIDAANAISYLHTDMEGKPWLIHRDIKSDNILLDENLNTKLADFGLSKFQHRKKAASVVFSKNLVGTLCYIDPEYLTAGKYKRESDTYSFGVVLFEVLSGRAAYDPLYTRTNEIGLAPIARKRFKEGTLKKIIDSKMTDEDDDLIFSLNKGPNKDSFDVFSKIAYRCLAETQAKRPTMELVISELQNSLKLQGDTVVLSKFLLHDIVLATDNFAETFCIGLDTNGTVYKAELQ
ncbi:hypothetical protein QVD17_37434 [Tagetes erecta]|uniref:non-specific serine/threonine protein kinase n=1 Tax=Tagetes erecta TaxID=13708 RepID=A0AAD8JY87_TARER|nr:hypothetical protein QVD17_37434 [Tagetes erecta]